MPREEDARTTAEAVARRSYGKLVAFLAARTGDVAAAEDALPQIPLELLLNPPERWIAPGPYPCQGARWPSSGLATG